MTTEEVEIQIERIQIQLKNNLEKIGIEHTVILDKKMFIPQNFLWVIDFERFQQHIGKGIHKELDDFVLRTTAYIEFVKKLGIVETFNPHIEYTYPIKKVRIYFMWENETRLKIKEEKWKLIFKEYGYESEVSAYEFKSVFQPEEAEKKVNTFITDIGLESKDKRDKVAEIVFAELAPILAQAREEMEQLRRKAKGI